MSKSNQELGPFGRSFIGDFPTVGTLSLLAVSFLLSALLSLGNLIPFLILFIFSSSLTVLFSYNFIEPHFNSKSIINGIGRMNKTSFSLESIKGSFISGSERPKEIISFKDAIRSFFKNWANLRGRASRSEYNWILLLNILIEIPIILIGVFIGLLVSLSTESNSFITLFLGALVLFLSLILILLGLALLIPSITLTIRRIHDIGYSGWYLLLLAIFIAIFYHFNIYLYLIFSIPVSLWMILSSGENIANKYGPIPSNKLNIDGTNFSLNDVWDLSGLSFSGIFHNDVKFQETRFDGVLNRKGPVIGNWQSETKFKTLLKIGVIFFTNYAALFMAAVFPIIFVLLFDISFDTYVIVWFTFQWLLQILIILIILYFEDKFSYIRVLFTAPSFKQSAILIPIITIINFILVMIYLFLYSSISAPPTDLGLDEIGASTSGIVVLFIALAITAPLLEEILFRGYILDKIRNLYSDNTAIIGTGILFGLMHWQIFAPFSFAQVGSATIAGFLYAWLRIKTGSIWPSIICHSLWNSTVFFIGFIL